MADIDCPWQDDFALDPTGDLALVDGVDLDNQHIERRLLTAVTGYLWSPDYGAGLPQRIGRPARGAVISAVVRQQIYLETTVARLPSPVITVDLKANANGLCNIRIDYTSAVTGKTEAIALEVPTAS